jgi:hypothetical protein
MYCKACKDQMTVKTVKRQANQEQHYVIIADPVSKAILNKQ